MSGEGFLEWRIKTVKKNCSEIMPSKRPNADKNHGGGPTLKRRLTTEGDEREEHTDIILKMQHTAVTAVNITKIMKMMKETYGTREKIRNEEAIEIIKQFPRFKDTPGLVIASFCYIYL